MSEPDPPGDDEHRRNGSTLWQSLGLDRFLDAVFGVERDPVVTLVPVTVVVGGSVITGEAVSFAHYLRLLADAVQAAGVTMQDGEGNRTRITDERLTRVYRNSRERILQKGPETLDPGMLFLKDARVLTGAGLRPSGGFLIALEMSQVQGWALGAMDAS